MCPTGIQLETTWRSTCTHYQIAPGQVFHGLETIQDVLKCERARVEYQTALEKYRKHLGNCPICKTVNLRDMN